MTTKNIYSISIYDYILAGTFGLISILLVYFFYFYNINANITATKTEIYQNNKMIFFMDLNKNKKFNYEGMEIEITDSKIRVRESNCPRKICVHSGWINSPNQRIICIPKKVIIEVTGVANTAQYQFDYEMK